MTALGKTSVRMPVSSERRITRPERVNTILAAELVVIDAGAHYRHGLEAAVMSDRNPDVTDRSSGQAMNQRTALVTGGNKGIGRACAGRLLGDGHRVVVTGRDEAALKETAEELGAFGDIDTLAFDVTDEEAVQQLLAPLEVDVCVANAGIAFSEPLRRQTLEDWNRILAVNATGVFLVARATVPGMRERDWGRLITVGSVASHHGLNYGTAYAASKHAALGFTRAVATEVAGSGVTANAVCPAFVDTPMTDRSVGNIAQHTGRDPDDVRETLAKMSLLGRLVAPGEVAAAVGYLASDAAAAVNGQSIVLDGGGVQQ